MTEEKLSCFSGQAPAQILEVFGDICYFFFDVVIILPFW